MLIQVRTSWGNTCNGVLYHWYACDTEALSASSGVEISWFLVSLWVFLESPCTGSDDVMLCDPSFPSSGHEEDNSAYFVSEKVVFRSHKGKTTNLSSMCVSTGLLFTQKEIIFDMKTHIFNHPIRCKVNRKFSTALTNIEIIIFSWNNNNILLCLCQRNDKACQTFDSLLVRCKRLTVYCRHPARLAVW